jgi:hypothetical protein
MSGKTRRCDRAGARRTSFKLLISPAQLILIAVLSFATTISLDAETLAIDLTQQERANITQYVTKQKIMPPVVSQEIVIGSVLPSGVLLRPPPATWGPRLMKFQYIYHDKRVILVNPANRTVVQIVR